MGLSGRWWLVWKNSQGKQTVHVQSWEKRCSQSASDFFSFSEMQAETCTILPMQNTYPLKWWRCKWIPTLEQISNYCGQPKPLDPNEEQQTEVLTSLKPWARLGSLGRPLHCSKLHSLRMQKENDNTCLCQDVRKISIRNVSAFKGQIFCTSAEFIFILSVSWMEEEIFFISLLLFPSVTANIQWAQTELLEERHRGELGIFSARRGLTILLPSMWHVYNALIYVI